MSKVKDLGIFNFPMEWDVPGSNKEITLKRDNIEIMNQGRGSTGSIRIEREEKRDFKKGLFFRHLPKMWD